MAITFTQEQQKQKNLIIVLALAGVLTLIVVWWGFFRGGTEKVVVAPVLTLKKVAINFDTLKKAELQALSPFPEIAAFEGDMGRENPFIPYEL